MTSIIKRGNVYHFHDTFGGKRYRVSLGVETQDVAKTLSRQINLALAEGAKSEKWTGLRRVLPAASFRSLTSGIRVLESSQIPDFARRWEQHIERKVTLGKLARSSADLYERTAHTFFDWLHEVGIQTVDQIDPNVVEAYMVHRKQQIEDKRGPGARGLTTEGSVLASIFELAIEENLLSRSPLRNRFKPNTLAKSAEPFTPDELQKLDDAVRGEDRLAFLLFRWTGMRCSDVCSVTWRAWDSDAQTLTWVTKKRKTRVVIPLTGELNQALRERCLTADPSDPILFGSTEKKLAALVRHWGVIAGVQNAHPHRFRDSFAVDLLSRVGPHGEHATIYDVAKLLGITVHTAEIHYAPFTEKLQEKVRGLLEKVV